jgi:membrane protein DedA with SNARE-associated domain
MNRTRFHLFTFFGSLPWCLTLAWIGYKLGEKWHTLGAYFHKLDAVIVVVVVAGAVWFIYDHFRSRVKA